MKKILSLVLLLTGGSQVIIISAQTTPNCLANCANVYNNMSNSPELADQLKDVTACLKTPAGTCTPSTASTNPGIDNCTFICSSVFSSKFPSEAPLIEVQIACMNKCTLPATVGATPWDNLPDPGPSFTPTNELPLNTTNTWPSDSTITKTPTQAWCHSTSDCVAAGQSAPVTCHVVTRINAGVCY